MNKSIRALIAALAFILVTIPTAYAQMGDIPSLKIITPAQDQTIYTNKVPILFAVENFQLVDPQISPTPVPGQGHILIWLDDANPTIDSAVKISQDNFTYSDVPYNQHTLKAELVANNNASLNPPQTITVSFTNAPVSSPVPVAASGFDKKTALVILVVVALVIIAAWWYTKEEDEEEKPKSETKKNTVSQKAKGRKTKRRK